MRMVISRESLCGHQGSMRCERCFPNIVEMKKDGICVLDQEDDTNDFLTLSVLDGQVLTTYRLTEEDFKPFEGESWQVVLEGIEQYRVEE